MATSIHYVSPVDAESTILVTKNNNWTNIKVYANGKLLHASEKGQELRLGTTLDVDAIGKIELELKKNLRISVNGTPYEMITKEAEEKVGNVSAIFWILTAFSTIAFILMLLFSSGLPLYNDFIILMAEQLFATLIYGTTAILLSKKVYWFYFIGASVYTFYSILTLLDIEYQMSTFGSIVAFIIRFFLLVMVLRIAPTIIKQMRTQKPTEDNTVLDQQ